MLLLELINLAVIAQTNMDTGNWFQYGIAGVLAFLLVLLLKYIIQKDKNDQDLAKQRSGMYREDNRIRDERFIKALESMDVGGDRFVEATNATIDKFIELVNKVMEQGNFQTQVLVELKTIVQKLPNDFRGLKEDILDHLEKININYDLTKKD